MAQDIKLEDGEKIHLERPIIGPTIICGFQGFGMVGALVVNHLIDEMDFKEIGSSQLREVPPLIVFKGKRILKPVSIFFNSINNIVLISILAPTVGIEWNIADMIETIAKSMKAKEIIIPDGIIAEDHQSIFYISNFGKDLQSIAKPVENSVVAGVTSALLMKRNLPVLCLLGNMKSDKFGAMAAAAPVLTSGITATNLVKVINRYLNLDVSTERLEQASKDMEKELGSFIDQLSRAKSDREQRYIG